MFSSTPIKLLISILFISTLLFAGCTGETANGGKGVSSVSSEGYTNINGENLQAELDLLPLEEPDSDEIEGLLFMREEEKLARDVYIALFDMWDQPIFDNISKSEETHTTAILALLDRYSIEDPVGDNEVGVFENSTLQDLHDMLVETGELSLVDALKVGTEIEEIDIIDLQIQIDEKVDNEDILMVYENLLRGSRNHLRAFVRNLSNQGVNYSPIHLSREDYDAIISSDIENGN
jgi:hypothetical protein